MMMTPVKWTHMAVMKPDRSDAFYSAALNSAPLSAETRRSYDSKVRRLQDITGVHHTVHWVLSHPAHVYVHLVDKTKDPTTRAACIGAVMSMYRHIPALKERYAAEYGTWGEYAALESVERAKRYDSNQPTPRQAAAHVPWADVESARDALPVDSIEYLLMAMYSFQPPARADYDRLAIRYTEPTEKDLEATPNYLRMQGPVTITMHLNAYKTKKVGQEGMTQDLPSHLCAVIWASLERDPREFLFTEARSGQPFKGADSYTKWAGRILKRVLNNPSASFNTLRHSYLNHLGTIPIENLSEAGRKEIARRMMHSPAMARQYAFAKVVAEQYDANKMGAARVHV